ncbi:MAG: amidohydrolase family protein [Anaerolineales bacterium]|nr:amidohydrolase family protein [Anaerolineales bacterium]
MGRLAAAYTPATAVIGIAVNGAGDPEMHPPLSVQEMIRGFTADSAATTGDPKLGSLDIGFKADFVVYEKDLYSVAPTALTKDYPKVLATYVGGSNAYTAAD